MELRVIEDPKSSLVATLLRVTPACRIHTTLCAKYTYKSTAKCWYKIPATAALIQASLSVHAENGGLVSLTY
ncbi:unnamed protein product [Chondrus crispus]|uniref:Uncharacterized protein n=1 Tax=Chondrus crispus TaxID=2769 RepID=R7Q9J0_CHOCR|nr:unnamed protein product [Chondrus crispus]CDF34448.1 unnamed protein product [Chondrus crispus]|eukprot:XP_005714267.1 unnamed protein product [Chondrus crispus]